MREQTSQQTEGIIKGLWGCGVGANILAGSRFSGWWQVGVQRTFSTQGQKVPS